MSLYNFPEIQKAELKQNYIGSAGYREMSQNRGKKIYSLTKPQASDSLWRSYLPRTIFSHKEHLSSIVHGSFFKFLIRFAF